LCGASRVLLVEDDVDICESVREELEEAGYQVTVANTIKEASTCLREGLRPSVMLIDYMMTDGTGSDLIAECRRHVDLRHIPTIMMSAARPADMPTNGAQRYLQKPFHPDELRAELARVLRRPGGE
jgi:DNA-binding response OmpR family regulator